MVDGVNGHDGDMHEPEERGEERKAFAYGPEQLIEDQSHDGVADERDEVGCAAETVERLVGEDVDRCGRGVARDDKPVAYEDFGEAGGEDDDQIKRTREPGSGTYSMPIRDRREKSSWLAGGGL
jgi:hypothetical protein